jgi:hypothetical protein
MGMTEQAEYMSQLRQRAQDNTSYKDARIEAWCEWGRMQKDTFNMGTALREIQNLINSR